MNSGRGYKRPAHEEHAAHVEIVRQTCRMDLGRQKFRPAGAPVFHDPVGVRATTSLCSGVTMSGWRIMPSRIVLPIEPQLSRLPSDIHPRTLEARVKRSTRRHL